MARQVAISRQQLAMVSCRCCLLRIFLLMGSLVTSTSYILILSGSSLVTFSSCSLQCAHCLCSMGFHRLCQLCKSDLVCPAFLSRMRRLCLNRDTSSLVRLERTRNLAQCYLRALRLSISPMTSQQAVTLGCSGQQSLLSGFSTFIIIIPGPTQQQARNGSGSRPSAPRRHTSLLRFCLRKSRLYFLPQPLGDRLLVVCHPVLQLFNPFFLLHRCCFLNSTIAFASNLFALRYCDADELSLMPSSRAICLWLICSNTYRLNTVR